MTFQVRRILDLSHLISADTQVYPGDPVPQLSPATTIDRDGYNVLHVSMGSQTGTHVDAPYHFLADGARIDAMELSMFLGPATVADVRDRTPRSTISWPQLEAVNFPEPVVSVLPIRLADADGAPVRAVALHLEWLG